MDRDLSSLLRQREYTVETAEGQFSGKYVDRESSEGFSFFYLENECEDYRISLVVRQSEDKYWCDVNKTDGSHETLARMVEFSSCALTTGE